MAEDIPQVLVNSGWNGTESSLNGRAKLFKVTSQVREFYDGVLWLCSGLCYDEDYQQHLSSFEELVTKANGIEGKCVFIWAGERDKSVKENIIKDLRLDERGCVWEIEFENGKHQDVCDFFEKNLFLCGLKPAKEAKKS